MCECALKIILLCNYMSVTSYYIPAEAKRTFAEWSMDDRRRKQWRRWRRRRRRQQTVWQWLIDVSRPTSIYKFLIRIHALINTHIYMWVYIIIVTMYSTWPKVSNFVWEKKSWVVVWSMVWPDFRSLSGRMSHVCGHGRDGTVRGNDLEDAVRRAKDQSQEADGDQHCVPNSHPDGHFVPVRGELYDHRHDDAKQWETKSSDESDKRSDCRYSHRDQHWNHKQK